MKTDNLIYYNAYKARDSRFDGIFYIGVTSTGIYCRPICQARTPKIENCKFFPTHEEAEKAGFRPCLRCRPEIAPVANSYTKSTYLANLLIKHSILGTGKGKFNLEKFAGQIGISSRQVRRIIYSQFGVSPLEMINTRRLLLAKQLLTETSLSIIDIAFASGFASLRRFNDAFNQYYKLSPSKLRQQAKNKVRKGAEDFDAIILKLAYRPPYNFSGILKFLELRAIKGVEQVDETSYLRTVNIGNKSGWLRVSNDPLSNTVNLEISYSLAPLIADLLNQVRHLFDLGARPDLIAEHLSKDPNLAIEVTKNPGLRVPGAFDGFELAVRAILGQQVSVKTATTLVSRFVARFGEPIITPFKDLNYLFPNVGIVSQLSEAEISKLGIIPSRARSIIKLAQEIEVKQIQLITGADPEAIIKLLVAIPGIGNWTANYIVMRALGYPDVFLSVDLVLRKRLGTVTAKEAEEIAYSWRPWRSYAVLYLWQKEA